MAGCGRFDHAERPAWRNQAEEACLAQHLVEPSDYLQPSHAIDGPGICGLNHPFKVYALAGGTVKLKSASLLDCSMIPALDAWIKDVVQPDAMARFGEAVVQINTMGTYSCRGINNMSGAKLSEHAFANAMDVGGFVLASGRELNVMRGWKSPDEQESAFLHDSHAGACSYFTTVLGPGYNIFHYNHIHMDLAMHGNTSRGPRRYCKPVPQAMPDAPRRDNLPDPPPIEEELDIAQTPIPAPAYSDGTSRSFVASVPDIAPYGRPRRVAARPAMSVAAMAVSPRVTAAPLPEDEPMPPASRTSEAQSLDLEQLGQSSEEASPVPPAQIPSAPRRVRAPEGRPADWDLTSLIKREIR
jgi:hypothetical protein